MLIEHRVDRRIRATEVRVIGPGGEQHGVLPIAAALALARDAGLHLVEVVPHARPPVCKVLDLGKLRYDEKRAHRARAKPPALKQVQLRPKIGPHDRALKLAQVRAFLAEGAQVRLVVDCRRARRSFATAGAMLSTLLAELADVARATAERPQAASRRLTALLTAR